MTTKLSQQDRFVIKQYYLIGGGEYTDKLEQKIETKILEKIDDPSVLIIPWTSDNSKTLNKYRKILFSFFKKYKVKNIIFLNKNDSYNVIKEKFSKADIIYLPGGYTKTLLKNIKKRIVTSLLRDFPGIIAGVSAGAYVLTKCYIQFQKDKTIIAPALNLVDAFIKAHYTPKMDNYLIPFSKKNTIYGIADNSALIFNNGKIDKVIGKVYLFDKGEKIKLN